MEELTATRLELAELSSKLYSLITKRRAIVKKIFTIKDPSKAFEPNIEIGIYQNPFFKNCSLEEALALSLLIENHASSQSNYPKWSQKIHLSVKNEDLTQMINPLLLLTISPKSFDGLQFTSEFKYLLDYR